MGVPVIEATGFFLASKIMDHPKLGRKKGAYYGLGITFIFSCLIPFIGKTNAWGLFVAFAVIKFVISVTFMVFQYPMKILYPYTAEIYETMIRGKALGICSMSGRIATALLGFVGVYAMHWCGGNGLYLIFVVLSGLSGYGAATMPFCTGNRAIS